MLAVQKLYGSATVAEGAPTVTLPEGGATPFNPLWEPSTPLTARAN